MSSFARFQMRLKQLQAAGDVEVFDPIPLQTFADIREEDEDQGPGNEFPQPCLYRSGELVVAEEARDEVESLLGSPSDRRTGGPGGVETWALPGRNIPAVALHVEANLDQRRDRPFPERALQLDDDWSDDDVREMVAEYRNVRRSQTPTLVGPNHIFTATPICSLGPADDPVPGYRGLRPPQVNAATGGRDVVIGVVDSGLLEDFGRHSWLAQGVAPMGIGPFGSGIEPADDDGDGHIDFPAGHGTFVSGIIRFVAPGATIQSVRLLDTKGKITEDELALALAQMLKNDPDIINLSLVGQSWLGGPPTALVPVWTTLLADHGGTVVVASAGNAGVPTPFWPAAQPEVLSVGAVDAGGVIAEFSNYSEPAVIGVSDPTHWVNVFALGVRVENAYASGTSIDAAGGRRHFNGTARWSGTSFAAPFVTGKIAARMASNGETAVQARDWVVANATASKSPDPRRQVMKLVVE